jgi:hypothetical protein
MTGQSDLFFFDTWCKQFISTVVLSCVLSDSLAGMRVGMQSHFQQKVGAFIAFLN